MKNSIDTLNNYLTFDWNVTMIEKIITGIDQNYDMFFNISDGLYDNYTAEQFHDLGNMTEELVFFALGPIPTSMKHGTY